MKYPIVKNQSADMNFNREQVVGLKKLTIGAGTNQFTLIGGKMWGGGNTFDTGIFQLDLGAKTLLVTGTVNATAGIFSGNITLDGTLTAGASGATIVLDGTNKKITFNDDSGNPTASLYNYATGGLGGKSVGLDAASTSGEVKLACGGQTRLVAKTYSGNPVIEFYGTQRVYCQTTAQLIFDSALVPLNNNSVSLGTSSKKWKALYLKEGIDINGHSGVDHTYGYTDDNGAVRYLVFTGGILTDQHS
jgi:hypothetical protein